MKKYLFIRRHLTLDSAEKIFTISKDELLKEEGDSYGEALDKLLKKLDDIQGTKVKIPNNGYPLDVTTSYDKAMYHASYGLAALTYENDNKKIEDIDSCRNNFIEELKRDYELSEENIYKGIYADPYLMYPHGLTVEDMRQSENNFSYIFYPEGGKYKGGLHRYLYLGTTIFKGDYNEVNKWHFQMEEIEILTKDMRTPYCFRGKLLSFAYYGTGEKEKNETYMVKLFRVDDGQYLLYLDFYDMAGKRIGPLSINLSPSPKMIYKRLQSKLQYDTSNWDTYNQSCFKKFMEEVKNILRIH